MLSGTTIQGLAFVLRRYRKADITRLPDRIGRRCVVENLLVVPYPYTIDDARRWVHRNLYSRPFRQANLNCAISIDDELVGGISLMEIERGHMAKLGYWVAEPWWGRGLATAAVGLIIDYGCREYGLRRIEAGIFGWNPASARVLEKNGFVCEGVLRRRLRNPFGRVGDEHMYARVR